MKQLITILLCLFTLFAEAQVNTNDTNKYFKSYDYGFSYKRLQAREAFIMPTDTVINKLGAVSLNGNIYLGNGVKWTSIGGGTTIDTTSLSNRINQRIDSLRRRSDSVFARKNGVFVFQYKDSIGGTTIDTTSLSNRINLKIDSLKRSNDSVYAYKNGTRVFQFKDSVGGGGGDFWKTSGTTDLTNNVTIRSDNKINFNGIDGETRAFNVNADSIAFTTTNNSNYIYFTGLNYTTDTTTYKPLAIDNTGKLAPLESWVSGGGGPAIDTTNQFVKRLTRTPGKDSIIYFVGANRFAIKDSVGTNPAPVGYYGSFSDSTTQTAALINTAYGVKLGVTDLSNGVTIANNTRIKIANAGIYNIQFSLQLEKSGGSGNMIADIWLRKNGVYLNGTTGKVVLTGSANASPVIAAWNYVIAVSSNDSLELMWATSNDNVVIKATAATSPHPSIPSAILTVTQQSGIMAGTGVSPLDTANMLSPYIRTNVANASIATKVNISDTANMLTNYARTNTVNASIATKVNITDANQTISAFQYLGSSIKFFPIGVNSFIQATTNLQFINTRIFLTAIYVPTTTTVTGVKWITGSAGTAYVGNANYNGIALYSYNVGTGLCTRIDSTASDANTWTTAGFNSKAFVTTASLSQGVYYLAAICNGTATTFPSIVQTVQQSANTTYDFTSPAKLTGNSNGTVSPASFNLSTVTVTTNTPVIALY